MRGSLADSTRVCWSSQRSQSLQHGVSDTITSVGHPGRGRRPQFRSMAPAALRMVATDGGDGPSLDIDVLAREPDASFTNA